MKVKTLLQQDHRWEKLGGEGEKRERKNREETLLSQRGQGQVDLWQET